MVAVSVAGVFEVVGWVETVAEQVIVVVVVVRVAGIAVVVEERVELVETEVLVVA